MYPARRAAKRARQSARRAGGEGEGGGEDDGEGEGEGEGATGGSDNGEEEEQKLGQGVAARGAAEARGGGGRTVARGGGGRAAARGGGGKAEPLEITRDERARAARAARRRESHDGAVAAALAGHAAAWGEAEAEEEEARRAQEEAAEEAVPVRELVERGAGRGLVRAAEGSIFTAAGDAGGEEWERHAAAYGADAWQRSGRPTSCYWNSDNHHLYEEEVSHSWEKGGSGLVFYTDDLYWEKHDGEREELLADDWHGDEARPAAATAAAAAAFHRPDAWRRTRPATATLLPRPSELRTRRRGHAAGAAATAAAAAADDDDDDGRGGGDAAAADADAARARGDALGARGGAARRRGVPAASAATAAAAAGETMAAVGRFERHTRGVGARVLARSGWRPGDGLGKRGQGVRPRRELAASSRTSSAPRSMSALSPPPPPRPSPRPGRQIVAPIEARERRAVEGLGWRPGAVLPPPAEAQEGAPARRRSRVAVPAPYMPAPGRPVEGVMPVEPSRTMRFGGMLLDPD